MNAVAANITNTTILSTPDVVQWTFFGWMGVAMAVMLSNMGAAYGTAKAGVGIGSMAVTKPSLVYKSLVPVVMAGILGIYGLIVAVILSGKIKAASANAWSEFKLFTSGLSVGMSSIAAGYAIGIVGDTGVRSNAINEDMFVAMILMMIFAEAIGLYGLIIAIIMSQAEVGGSG